MYCIKCGKQIEENSKFCCYCGANLSNLVTPIVTNDDKIEKLVKKEFKDFLNFQKQHNL